MSVTDVLHGVPVSDPYRWLEDAKSPEVQAWMKAQDDLTRQRLASLPGRDALAARLKELYYIDSVSAPQHRGTRYFFTRKHSDKEKSVVYWKEGADGAEKVLLDPNTWSADGSASLGGWQVSWDGTRVAYQKKINNSDEATLYVMDVATGTVSDVDVIEGAKYARPSWTPDGKAFYYTWLPVDPKIPTADRPGYAEVRLHRLGSDPKSDAVVKDEDGRSDDLPGRQPDARRPLPLPRGLARVDVPGRVVPRSRRGPEGHGLDAARGRDQGAFRHGRFRREDLRQDGRRGAEEPHLLGRSREAGARLLEGDRAGAQGRDAGGILGRSAAASPSPT